MRSHERLKRFPVTAGHGYAFLFATGLSWALTLSGDFTARGIPLPMAELAFVILLAFSAILVMPGSGYARPARAVLPWAWSVLVSGTCLAVGLAGHAETLTSPGVLFILSCTVVLFASLVMLTSGRSATGSPARVLWIVVGVVATLAPLWLAPLAEAAAPEPTVANLAIGISPLSYLSVAADYDFLRSPWFYGRSAIGSLRYEYPGLPVYAALCLGTGAAASLISLYPFRRRVRAAGFRNPQGEHA